ncbi:MAG: heme ABC exporter ATP-binding protein CcmA [Dehalococcoidales bacterium]|nr:heme ABC exporter ATP-binding protein CcmA [Dehalococcoidales bacterium]
MMGSTSPATDVAGSVEIAVEVDGITKNYGSAPVLKGVNLQVRKGEKITIVGPNGAGKTTLLRIISTISRPQSGRAWIAGFDILTESVEVRRHIGVISHQPYLYNDLSVAENLRFYGRMYDVPNLDERVRVMAAKVGLAHRLYDGVGTLSRGMQQRVSIARAAIHNPEVMLLDEPDTGLDQQAAGMLKAVLDADEAAGRTVVMTTHNLELGLSLCDRVALLVQGRIVHTEEKRSLDIESFRKTYYRFVEASS